MHTRGGAEQLARFGVPAERVVRIPHGTFDTPTSIEPPAGRTLLFFGLIRRYKGLDVLVRALAEVPDARLVVAGDPLDPVEPIRALAVELGVADRIEWRLGYLQENEIERLMREATLAVFPYRGGESASGALATALGHGRPAVVSDVLGELVEDYGAGAVVPRGRRRACCCDSGCSTIRLPWSGRFGPRRPHAERSRGTRSQRLTNSSIPASSLKSASCDRPPNAESPLRSSISTPSERSTSAAGGRPSSGRWWLPVLGLLLGLAVGYALALGGGEVYRAAATLYLGQPFSPNGGAPVPGSRPTPPPSTRSSAPRRCSRASRTAAAWISASSART